MTEKEKAPVPWKHFRQIFNLISWIIFIPLAALSIVVIGAALVSIISAVILAILTIITLVGVTLILLSPILVAIGVIVFLEESLERTEQEVIIESENKLGDSE